MYNCVCVGMWKCVCVYCFVSAVCFSADVLFYCISPTKRHMHCVQTILNSKADVNSTSASGKHVFVLACEHAQDCEDMCMSILEKGANQNAYDEVTQQPFRSH